MIKIKRINPEKFYDNLRKTALEHDSKLKAFGKNEYYNWGKGFYYSIDGNKTTIYYETGEVARGGGLVEHKMFLLCRHIKIFKQDFVFATLVVNMFWAIPVFLVAFLYSLAFGNSTVEIILSFASAFVFFYLWNIPQSLKLLNYIDEICK